MNGCVALSYVHEIYFRLFTYGIYFSHGLAFIFLHESTTQYFHVCATDAVFSAERKFHCIGLLRYIIKCLLNFWAIMFVFNLCFAKCGMGGIRTHYVFSVIDCAMKTAENGGCPRGVYAVLLLGACRITHRRSGGHLIICHNSPLRGKFLPEQDLFIRRCRIGCYIYRLYGI